MSVFVYSLLCSQSVLTIYAYVLRSRSMDTVCARDLRLSLSTVTI